MEDLTKLNTSDLKKDIFNLMNFIYPKDLQVENGVETHIFHALKINREGDKYSIVDTTKKPTEVYNKFLLYKIKEELEGIIVDTETEVAEEIAVEALAQSFEQAPDPVLIEEIEKELRIATIFAEEEATD